MVPIPLFSRISINAIFQHGHRSLLSCVALVCRAAPLSAVRRAAVFVVKVTALVAELQKV